MLIPSCLGYLGAAEAKTKEEQPSPRCRRFPRNVVVCRAFPRLLLVVLIIPLCLRCFASALFSRVLALQPLVCPDWRRGREERERGGGGDGGGEGGNGRSGGEAGEAESAVSGETFPKNKHKLRSSPFTPDDVFAIGDKYLSPSKWPFARACPVTAQVWS